MIQNATDPHKSETKSKRDSTVKLDDITFQSFKCSQNKGKIKKIKQNLKLRIKLQQEEVKQVQQ